MATLTETAYYTRKGVKLTIAVIVGIFILRILIGMGQQVWLALFPPPPPPATMAFGLLPKIKFPVTGIATNSGNLSYILDTIDGKLPVFPLSLKVYFVPKVGSTFGKDEKMRAQAVRMGFTTEPQKIFGKTDDWRFSDPNFPLRHLDYNATYGFFLLSYDYGFDLNLFAGRNFLTQDALVKDAQAFYSNLGLLQPDLIAGTQKILYYKLATNSLVPATALSEADAVRVNFFRGTVVDGKNNFAIVNPDPKNTNVSILFSGNLDKNKKILEANYNYSAIDYENFATYPIISADKAYEMLKTGQGYIASSPAAPGRVSIRSVTIGYYDSPAVQSYLQPVIIFSDTKGFEAYVPAVNASLFAP